MNTNAALCQILLMLCLLLVTATGTHAANVLDMELVSTTRSGRTTFDYRYRIRIENNGDSLSNAVATITSSSAATVIVDATVQIGDLPANQITTPNDTFTLRQNRRVTFNPSVLTFAVTGDPNSNGPATFIVDPQLSTLTLSDTSFQSLAEPPFVTAISPVPGMDLARSVAGSIVADSSSGALESGSVVLLGAPLMVDQLRFIPNLGEFFDIGDVVLTDFGLYFDAQSNATLNAGSIEFDLSTGSTRILSTAPIDLSGETSGFTNLGSPPSVVMVGGKPQLTVPVRVNIVDLQTPGSTGTISFTVSGTLVANLQEQL